MGTQGRLRRKVDRQRIERLTAGPVLRTLAGTRARLAALDWQDLRLLCRHFGTDIGGLESCLWTGRRRRPVQSSNGNHQSTVETGVWMYE
ncbi:MAG: hypothetical protein ABFE13_07535 [Phycisphaerales bacterium]